MRRTGLISGWLALVTALPAASADLVVQRALAAEARFDTPAALALYQEADGLRPNDAVILQNISRQYSDSSSDVADPAEQRRRCATALTFARRAVALQPHSAVNVLSLAICYGKLGRYSDTRTRIEYSRLVKQYADEALALDPGYDYAHHVLGRWNYEVASLGLGTRWIVRLIYGGLPEASTAEAVRQLRRATELSPDRPAHQVELGFALLADGQRTAARQAFERALDMPQREKYDEEAWRRARVALEKLR
jgi:tetratricopeptide (TPR) repeat protein